MSIFSDEDEAVKFLEKIYWPDGPVCDCGSKRHSQKDGASFRIGLKRCKQCLIEFTVRGVTIFKGTKMPLYKWLRATVLICRVGGATNAKISKDIAIHRNTARTVRALIEGAGPSQLSPLVRALTPHVGSPLREDPTVNVTRDQLLIALQKHEDDMIKLAQAPRKGATAANGVQTAPGS